MELYIGVAMIAMVFVWIFIQICVADGIKAALISFGFAFGLVAWVAIAMNLIESAALQ